MLLSCGSASLAGLSALSLGIKMPFNYDMLTLEERTPVNTSDDYLDMLTVLNFL